MRGEMNQGSIGVGKGLGPPRPPNRACGSPAHGSPVVGFLIGSASRRADLYNGRSGRPGAKEPSAQRSWPSERLPLAPLPPAATGGIGTMKALTPADLTRIGRSLRLRRLAVPAFRPQPRELPAGRFLSRLSAGGCFQASPWMSRLATASRRIRFLILRTAGSPPVAPHPASRRRSYLQLQSLRPAPARTSTVLTKRPRGRTHPREGGDPLGRHYAVRSMDPAFAGVTREGGAK
jgi:hypothetical protein